MKKAKTAAAKSINENKSKASIRNKRQWHENGVKQKKIIKKKKKKSRKEKIMKERRAIMRQKIMKAWHQASA